MTKEPVKGNYTKYMPSTTAGSTISGWHIDKEPTSFKFVEEEFPDLSDTEDGGAQLTETTSWSKSKPSSGNGNGNVQTQQLLQLPFRPAKRVETASVAVVEPKAPASFQLPIRLLNRGTLDSSEDNRGHDDGTPSPVQTLRPAFRSGVSTVTAGMDPDDPDCPSFNASRYYCVYSNKYNCPKRLCG